MPPTTSCVLNKLFYLLPVFCLLALSACGNKPTTGRFSPLAVADNHASVYIYRPSRMSNAVYAPELYIKQSFRLKIGNGRKVHFFLPPGDTRFEIKSDFGTAGPDKRNLHLEPGKTYYLRIDTSLKLDQTIAYTPYRRGFSLEEIPESRALQEIALCCSEPEAPAAKKAEPAKPGTTRDTGGFSVNKTRNPFKP